MKSCHQLGGARSFLLLPAAASLLLAGAADLAAQGAGPVPDAVPVAVAAADSDGDFVPDRTGDTVTVTGRATVGTGILHASELSVFLQDSTGGIHLYGESVAEPVQRGERVAATGVIDHYRGETQLDVLSYRVVRDDGPPQLPAPTRLDAPDAELLEASEGELVRLSGVVVGRGANQGGDFLWVFPDDGDRRVQVFAAEWRGRPVDLAAFEQGDRIELTGLLGQYDAGAPFTSWYQVYPRTGDDLDRPAGALGLTATQIRWSGGGLLLLLVAGIGWWGYRGRRERAELAERHQILFDRNQAGVFLTTVDGEILACNSALARMYGYDSPEELTERRAWELYREMGDREDYLRSLHEEGEVEDYLHHHTTRDGEDLWVLENARLVRTEDGEERIVGTAVNLTDRVRAEQRQKAAEERYRALFEQNVAGAFRSAPGGRLLEVNPAFADMLGYDSPEELEGTDAKELYGVPERRDELMETLSEEGSLHNKEIALQSRAGDTVWVLENSFLVDDPETGEVVNIGTVTEITEHVREEQALEEMAHRDPLTGIPNRRYLEETVPQILAQAQRGGECIAVVYLDLDDFKEINDQWGHGTGDAVLQAVASRLEGTVREADLVGRVGGDEFLIVLTGVDEKGDGLAATRRLIGEAFEEPVEAGDETFPLGAKLGVAVCPEDGTEFGDLLTRADRAMYRASRNGEVVELYDEELDQPYAGRLRRHREIHEALERGEIVAHAQPVYRLTDGRLADLEFLARWRREDGELVRPADLIPRARSAGRLADLDLRVLRLAAEHAAEWRAGTVSVNVSDAFLEAEAPVRAIRDVLREHPAAGDHLTIEVTERTALEEAGSMRSVLREIADTGLRLSLDDFGTGYSSLSLLERLSIDEVKVDRSLIQNISQGGRAEDLLTGVLNLTHALDAVVVAEGVERREQLHWLSDSECDRVQGFLLGRPAPPDRSFAATVREALDEAAAST